jgi:hypothetical protein
MRDGEPPGTGRKPLHHNVFFWVAGFFLLVALLSFIFLSSPSVAPKVLSPQTTAPGGVVK